MKGQILDFSIHTNSGVISGDDGMRYNFSGSEWHASDYPAVGMRVDFDIRDNSAVGVYLDPTFASASTIPEGAKSKVAAGVLAILLGGLGIHKFYLGYTNQGLILLAGLIVGFITAFIVVGFFVLFAIGIIALIEGIIYLTKSDLEFHQTYVEGRKPWF